MSVAVSLFLHLRSSKGREESRIVSRLTEPQTDRHRIDGRTDARPIQSAANRRETIEPTWKENFNRRMIVLLLNTFNVSVRDTFNYDRESHVTQWILMK